MRSARSSRHEGARLGRFINVASAHGLVASPFKAAYVAAKHGIIGLTKTVALEGAEFGVTANAICPGYVWTPLVEQQIDDQAKSHGISRERVIKEVSPRGAAEPALRRGRGAGQVVAVLLVPGSPAARSPARRRRWTAAGPRDERQDGGGRRGLSGVNLALQGGGAHGAFTWGVLDRLLQDERIVIDGISGTSAGAMNGAMVAYGHAKGGTRRSAGRRSSASGAGSARRGPCHRSSRAGSIAFSAGGGLDYSVGYQTFDALSRLYSPYQFNLLDLNPLRGILVDTCDFSTVRSAERIKLLTCLRHQRAQRQDQDFRSQGNHARCVAGVGVPAAALPRRRDRWRYLTGTAAISAIRRSIR